MVLIIFMEIYKVIDNNFINNHFNKKVPSINYFNKYERVILAINNLYTPIIISSSLAYYLNILILLIIILVYGNKDITLLFP